MLRWSDAADLKFISLVVPFRAKSLSQGSRDSRNEIEYKEGNGHRSSSLARRAATEPFGAKGHGRQSGESTTQLL